MDLLRLSLKLDFKTTSKILKDIVSDDKKYPTQLKNLPFKINENQSYSIVAEISANHCGKLAIAKKLIRTAKINNADAVKLQTYTADTMTIKLKKIF